MAPKRGADGGNLSDHDGVGLQPTTADDARTNEAIWSRLVRLNAPHGEQQQLLQPHEASEQAAMRLCDRCFPDQNDDTRQSRPASRQTSATSDRHSTSLMSAWRDFPTTAESGHWTTASPRSTAVARRLQRHDAPLCDGETYDDDDEKHMQRSSCSWTNATGRPMQRRWPGDGSVGNEFRKYLADPGGNHDGDCGRHNTVCCPVLSL